MKRVLFFVLLFVAGVAAAAFVFRARSPVSQLPRPLPTPYTLDSLSRIADPPYQKTPEGTKFVLQLPPTTLPSSLPVLSLAPLSEDFTGFAAGIAVSLDIRGEQKRVVVAGSDGITWTANERALTVVPQRHSISFSNASAELAGAAPTQPQAHEAVVSFLKSAGLEALVPRLSLFRFTTTDQAKDMERGNTTEKQALITYSFLAYQNYPLMSRYLPNLSLQATVSPTGLVRRLSLTLEGLPGEPIKESPPVSIDLVAEALNAGRGTLVAHNAQVSSLKELTGEASMVGVVVSGLSIAYVPDVEAKILYPVYLLSGSVSRGTPQGTVVYVLPAVPL